MDELTPAMELAFDYGRQLRAVQPDHELLKYLDQNMSPKLDQEFTERFWDKPFSREGRPGHLVNATIWANYAVALKQALEGPRYLSDFLLAELKDYVTLDGKAINPSTSHCIPEGREEFNLKFLQPLQDDLLVTIGRFYRQRWLKVTFNGNGVQIRLQGRIIKFAVVTDTHRGAMVSVKRVS